MTTAGGSKLGECVVCGGELSAMSIDVYCGPPVVGGMVHRCKSCSSGQVVPLPTADALAKLYSSDYYGGYGAGAGMAGGDAALPEYLKERIASLERRFGAGRLLDLGCGTGVLVAYARGHGWTAMGLETSSWAAAEARHRFGIEVIERALEDASIPASSLDVVHANHVLEHLVDPVRTLEAAFQMLRPGGVLMAEVPQELREPLTQKVVRLVRKIRSAPNYHLIFFSRRGLVTAVERAGFIVERASNLRHHDTLRGRGRVLSILRALILAIDHVMSRDPVYEIVARRPDDSDADRRRPASVS